MLKKIVCIILSLVMIFSVTGVAFAEKSEKYDTPVIVIPGFMQTALRTVTEDGIIEKVWLPDFLGKPEVLVEDLPQLIISLFGVFKDDPEGLGDALMELIADLAPGMFCNPDGTSIHPVEHQENDPAKRNMAYIKSGEENVDMQAYYTFANYICENGYADAENVFVFEYDGRMDAMILADELRTFIGRVKEYTGKDKVTLFGVSYGRQIAETYLHFYMDDNDVEKAVLQVPSLGGTNFADRILLGKVEFALDDVIDIAECIMKSDTEFNRILKDASPEFFSRLLNGISPRLSEFARYWGSVYSLTTPELYENLKKTFLDETASAELIKRNDIIHYEVMPQVQNTLLKCQEKGIYVAIHAASGHQLALGGEENSDLLLSVKDVTGAATTLFGKRFKDGYKGVGTNCSNEKHNHISPSGEIDATTAFLPEHTWFVDGQHHAMFQYENYGLTLAAKAVCTDELKDVHSDPAYPQFRVSDNPHRGVYAEFDCSTSGFIGEGDTKLIVENTYKNNTIRLVSVKVKGADISFGKVSDITLKPGEKAELSFTGDLSDADSTKAAITVKYLKRDTVSTVTERKFDFTLQNGVTDEKGELIVDNEYYNGDTSGMPFLQRMIHAVTYVIDLFRVLSDFLTSDAFSFLI